MARTPLWQTIATALSADIADGHYPPGAKLPTEAELAARFGVNRHTVRHGIKSLAEQGVVHSRRGAGVFVAARPTDYPLSRRTRFSQNLSAAGRIPAREILRLETRPADAREAEALSLETGTPVHVFEGLSLADDMPMAIARSVFPAQRFPGLLAGLERTRSVTHALSDEGLVDYTRASTRIDAKLANATQALHLRIREGAPILRTTSVNVDDDGAPVEFGRTWFAADRVSLTISPTDL